jgi:hypothetical protein
MPPNKKCKITATTTKRTSFVPAQQKSIQAFGKVTKAARSVQYAVKKEHSEDEVATATYAEERSAGCSNGKKRKLVAVHEIEVQERSCLHVPISAPCRGASPILRSSLQSDRESPSSKALLQNLPGLPSTDTPTKGAQGCLGILNLASSPPSTQESVLSAHASISPLSSQSSTIGNNAIGHASTDLPNELLDLVDLTSSFLTALSLHYAHHGSWTPVDLRILTPSIERSWGKRKVTTEDVRRILGLMDDTSTSSGHKCSNPQPTSTLKLSDYGHGKLCIEISGASANRGFMARPLDEKALNAIFLRNLTVSYKSWANKDAPGTSSITDFIGTLSPAPLHTCPSLHSLSPLTKGQRRLTDLKAGAVRTKKDILNFQGPSRPHLSTPDTTTSNRPKTPCTQTRKSSLRDRIRAKEFHQSTLPAPPSRASLDRTAALQRLEEVVPVLNILSTSANSSSYSSLSASASPVSEGKKLSFTLPALVQTLQNSLRNPISKAEAELCVVLLAGEVAPEWVRVVRCGKVVGVVVSAGKGLGMGEVRGRVSGLLGLSGGV